MKSLLKFTLLTLSLCLSACAWIPVHKVPVQQGNVVTSDMIKQLRPGLTREQTEAILGAPVLVNTFRDNQEAYVYTMQKDRKDRTEKHLNLYFKSGRLVNFKSENIH